MTQSGRRARRVGVLTSGGDCPGLNTAIRALVFAGARLGWEVVGSVNGFHGLMEGGETRSLTPAGVRPIFGRGGTVLGTVNRGDPFTYPDGAGGTVDRSHEIVAAVEAQKLDTVFVIGGEGSLAIAGRLDRLGVPVIGIPKTIDNDVVGTELSIGFDTAVETASLNIDRLHTTAESHARTMIVEVMGRHAGWLALWAGVASGADVILIPEIPYDPAAVAASIRARRQHGDLYFIVVVAEGAFERGGAPLYQQPIAPGEARRLGGVGQVVAEALAAQTGQETRWTALGHILRGGEPTPTDRVLATRLASAAVELAESRRSGQLVGVQGGGIVNVPLDQVAGKVGKVATDADLVTAARRLGICLGDDA